MPVNTYKIPHKKKIPNKALRLFLCEFKRGLEVIYYGNDLGKNSLFKKFHH